MQFRCPQTTSAARVRPMNKLKQLISLLRSSLWFVPSVMVLGAIALAILLIDADGYAGDAFISAHPRILGAGAEGARGMLTSISGSMITIAGLAFSLTIVAMAQASQLYTSRILRTLMGDRANQFVLGYFVSVFVYCLIVLRTIRGGEAEFVPSIAVFAGLLLAIASVPVLVFFIHHIAESLQASSIISRAAAQTLKAVEQLFPQKLGDEAEESDVQSARVERPNWHPIPALKAGYIQAVGSEELVQLAQRLNAVVRMERAIGDFTERDSVLATICFNGPQRGLDPPIIAELNRIYTISDYRTIEQDAAFGIRQLVDIALRALSPASNDQTTATVCIDFLGAILAALASRRVETSYRSVNGEMHVIAKGPSFRSLVNEALDRLRDAAAEHVEIHLRLLGALEAATRRTTSIYRRRILAAQVDLIASHAERSIHSEHNQALIRQRLAEVRSLISAGRYAVDRPAVA